jgi:predicted ArsR family transcriptional regulator
MRRREGKAIVQAVRQRIVEIIKSEGAVTVAELADSLQMAQVSVRHHLDILIGEDLVVAAGVRRHEGAGRPSQVYELTDVAAKLFPQRSAILAADMLGEIKAVMPNHEVRELLLRLAEKTARTGPRLSPDSSVEEKLNAISEFLTEQGYNAHWEVQDGRYELHACNCPYTGVADDHPELCMMDQAMIQHLMPDLIRLESRVLDGTTQCRYTLRLPAGEHAAA